MAKIEEEIIRAKAAVREEELREKLYSIKTLCEVVLAEGGAAPVQREGRPLRKDPLPAAGLHAAQGQGQKLELDDEANGDSLFDF